MITLDIVREGGDWDRIADVDALCARAAAEAARVGGDAAGQAAGVASLLLTDDAAMRELNRRWRGHDKATNVLSFPASNRPAGDGGRQLGAVPPGDLHLGDLAIAFETTVREASENGRPPTHHLAHLVVHGVLHLLGRDHDRPDEADLMEELEVMALAAMGIDDPYAGTCPAEDGIGVELAKRSERV